MSTTRWRKSTRSGQQTNCVEVAHTLDRVRDSKHPEGPALRIDALALIQLVRAGGLPRP